MKRKLFYAGNFLILGLFIVSCLQDADREWKDYQKAYKKLEIERTTKEFGADSEQALGAHARPTGIKQLMANDLGRFDRCITCHQGFDPLTNPSLTTPYAEHPFKTPANDIHVAHNVSKFGCTVCHGGQGLATTAEAAHGHISHWEEPMLGQPYIQSSCVKCHGDYKKLAGAQTAVRGKQLMDKVGCVGCHSMKGVGGEISVDLGDIADKPVSRIDWSNMTHLDHHEWNIKEWIEAHFTRDTMEIVPGDPYGHNCPSGQTCEPVPPSGMPPFAQEFSLDDAQAVTTYLLGKTDKTIPKEFYVFAAPEPAPTFASAVAHGKYVFNKYGCAGCHGEGGAEGRRNYNARGENQTKMEDGREPTLTKTVGTFTREELKKKLRDGVPPTAVAKFKADGPTPPLYMPAWKDKIKGKELEDLVTYLLSIAEKEEEEW